MPESAGNQLFETLRRSPGPLLAWVDSQSLAVLLWIGLGLFSVAFVIVMRTRWGSAKTVAKCVWLSVFVHLLLGGLAYGTKLFLSPLPQTTTYKTVSIQLVVDPLTEEPAAAEQAVEEADSQPADSPAVAAAAQPPAAEPMESLDEAPTESLAADLDVEIPPVPEEALPPAIASAELFAANEAPEQDSPPPEPEPAPPSTAESQPESTDAANSSPTAAVESTPTESPEELAATQPLPRLPTEVPDVDARSMTQQTMPALSPLATAAAGHAVNAAVPDVPVQPRFSPPVLYSLRDPENRLRQALARGGSRESELAVDAALQWLAACQKPEGNWDANETGAGRETFVLGHDRQGAGRGADTAMTGLALLAFLGAGHTPTIGEYRDVVARGLQYLIDVQDPSGHLAGRSSLFAHMYSHGIATLAMSEALALTGDPVLQRSVQNAIGYSIRAQDPQTGSWRYRPREPGDMSQFGWQILALKSAELGGVTIPQTTWDRANHFVELCSSGPQRGLSGYRPGHPPSETMTAESLLCRCFLRQAVPPAVVEEASRYIASARPGTGEVNYYLWYYGTMALYQSGSPDWTRWNESLQNTLVRTQLTSGAERGSWPANGKWSGYGGPVYSTAMAALSLEVYYRYLPIVNIRTASR